MSPTTTRYDHFFTHCHTLFGVIDAKGYFCQVNYAWQSLLGYDLDALSAHLYLDLVHPDDQAQTTAVLQQLTNISESITVVNRFQHRDGNYQEMVWQITPINQQTEFCMVAIPTAIFKTHLLPSPPDWSTIENTSLPGLLGKKQQELTLLQTELQDRQVALTIAQEDHVELSAQLETAQQNLVLLQAQLQGKQTALLSLQQDNVALNTHLEEAQQHLATLQIELEEKQADLNWLEEENNVLRSVLINIREGVVVQYADKHLQTLNAQVEQILTHPLTPTDFEQLWYINNIDPNTTRQNKPDQLVQLKKPQGGLLELSVCNQALYHPNDVQPYAKIVMFYDPSSQYSAELTLRHLKDDFDIIMQSKREGVLDWDLQNNQVTYSTRWKTIFGYTHEDVCTHIDAWYSRIHPSDHSQVMREVKNCLESVKTVYEKVHRVQHKDGSYRWVTSQGTALRDSSGRPYRFMATFIDITERKRAEETLEVTEKYERLFTTHPDAILLIENNGTVAEMNPAALNLYGYNRKEVTRLTQADLFASEINLAHLTAHTTYPGYHRKRDGSLFSAEIMVNELRWQTKRLFIVTVRDVTTAQQQTAQLIDNERKYHQLFEAESEAVIVFNAQTQQIFEVNQAAIQLYGYTYPEWLELNISTLFDKADSTAIGTTHQELPQKFSAWHRKKDNTRFPVTIAISQYTFKNQILVCAMVHDMTLYQPAQEFANTLLQTSPVFFIVLSPAGKIIFVNETLLKALSYTLEELQNKPYQTTLVLPTDRHRFEENLATLLSHPETRLLMEITVLAKNQYSLLLECHCQAVLDTQQQVTYILNIGIDIRERKEAQQQLHLYKSIVETSQEAIFVSTPNAQLVYINPAHEKLFKFHDFVPNKYNYRDYCTPATLRTIEHEIVPKIAQGQTWEGILPVFDFKGCHFPIWGRFDAIRDNQGRFLFAFGLMHDVTKQQEMEASLRYEREQYETIFHAAPLSIIYKDKENRVIKANRYVAQIAKFMKPSEMEGKSVYELFPQYAEEYYLNDLEVIKTGKPKLGLREKHSGGYSQVDKIPYRDANSNIVGVIVFSVDITRRLRTERAWRQKQQALQESEAQLRLTIEQLPMMIWAVDTQLNITLWNRHCERVTGYTADEIINNPQAWQLLYPDTPYREQIIGLCQQQLEHHGEFCQLESHLTCKNGKERTITWSIINMVRIEGSALWGVGQEISKREEQTVKLLRESEERLQSIIQNVPIMLNAYDESGAFLFWNQQCEKVTGYSAQEIVGNSNALKWLYPQTELYQQVQQFCLQPMSLWQYETEINCKDGNRKQIIWSNISKQYPLPGWFGWMIGEDISAFKQIQADFVEKDSLLSAILDSFPMSIGVTDRRGRFVYLNEAYCNLHGYSAKELLNSPLTVVIPPDNQNVVLRQYFSFLNQTGENTFTETYTALHKRGFLVEAHRVVERIEQENGQVYVIWLVNQVEE
ncbi:PAS domain S-box [Thioploca ingrica]|uniref:histidine kinase n=1 Tax=Thioploca ingrica TaxID=40754 RepID=A0A090AIM9_9GAMM|nr:PAS domain S-box [Thioploca ingrica]